MIFECVLGAKELADTKEVETAGSTDFTNKTVKTIPKPNGTNKHESNKKVIILNWLFLFD